MPRCPDCNKFVGVDENDPEFEDYPTIEGLDPKAEILVNGHPAYAVAITGSVKIVNACSECGTELKEAQFDIDCPVHVLQHEQDNPEHAYDLEVAIVESERISRQEGKSRARTYYGVEATFMVRCTCDKFETSVVWQDEVQASHMDDMT